MNTNVFINKSNSFNPIKSYDFTIENKYNTNIKENDEKEIKDNPFSSYQNQITFPNSNESNKTNTLSINIKNNNLNDSKDELIKQLYEQIEKDEKCINEYILQIENLKKEFEKINLTDKKENEEINIKENNQIDNKENEDNKKDKEIKDLKIQIQKLLKSDKKLKKELLYLKKKYDKIIIQSENTSLVLGREKSEILDLKTSYYTMTEVQDNPFMFSETDFLNKNYQNLLNEYDKIKKENEKNINEKNLLHEKIKELILEKDKIEKENLELKLKTKNNENNNNLNNEINDIQNIILQNISLNKNYNLSKKDVIEYFQKEKEKDLKYEKLKIEYENNKKLLEEYLEENKISKQQNSILKKAMIEMKKKYDNEYKCVSSALAELIKKYKSLQTTN